MSKDTNYKNQIFQKNLFSYQNKGCLFRILMYLYQRSLIVAKSEQVLVKILWYKYVPRHSHIFKFDNNVIRRVEFIAKFAESDSKC